MNRGRDRTTAILTARDKIALQPVYLDTETTGLADNDSILEISVIDHDGTVLVDTLVKPTGRIHPDALHVHGIHDEMVRDAPRWTEIWPQVETALAGRVVGIYNADFDLRLIQQTHKMHWMRWQIPEATQFFCIMKLYAQFYGQINPRYGSFRWQSLDAASKQCQLPLSNTHRAKDDTLLAQAVLQYMAEQTD
jgi:DNA polymerase-3 subunit epsilon